MFLTDRVRDLPKLIVLLDAVAELPAVAERNRVYYKMVMQVMDPLKQIGMLCSQIAFMTSYMSFSLLFIISDSSQLS